MSTSCDILLPERFIRESEEEAQKWSIGVINYRIEVIFAVVIGLLFSLEVNAQTVATDSISHERILVGPVERSAFQDSSWYKDNYVLYKPSAGLIHQIDSLGAGDSILVVLGSWCSDSHMWVPMFLSITDSTMLAHKIGFITVPRSKGWREQLTQGLDIEKVPTFIFYHVEDAVHGNGKEIGRIIEEPKGDLGDAILEILTGTASSTKGTKPSEETH